MAEEHKSAEERCAVCPVGYKPEDLIRSRGEFTSEIEKSLRSAVRRLKYSLTKAKYRYVDLGFAADWPNYISGFDNTGWPVNYANAKRFLVEDARPAIVLFIPSASAVIQTSYNYTDKRVWHELRKTNWCYGDSYDLPRLIEELTPLGYIPKKLKERWQAEWKNKLQISLQMRGKSLKESPRSYNPAVLKYLRTEAAKNPEAEVTFRGKSKSLMEIVQEVDDKTLTGWNYYRTFSKKYAAEIRSAKATS